MRTALALTALAVALAAALLAIPAQGGTVPCQTVIVQVGWNGTPHLARQCGGVLRQPPAGDRWAEFIDDHATRIDVLPVPSASPSP